MALPRPTALLVPLVVVAALSSGCWLAQKGAAPPDLSQQISEAERRAQRIQRIIAIMQRDLDEFETLRAEFFETPPRFYRAPFPLDLFKHVAMACLNEPWNPAELEDDDSSGTVRLKNDIELTCRPTFADQLDEQLRDRAPSRREKTLQKLSRIDKLRRLRGQLRERIGRIPRITRSQRDYTADARAELRQLQSTLKRRRTEYSTERWNQAQKRLQQQKNALDALERAVKRLDTAWPAWPERVDQNVLELYMRLSKLPSDRESWRN